MAKYCPEIPPLTQWSSLFLTTKPMKHSKKNIRQCQCSQHGGFSTNGLVPLKHKARLEGNHEIPTQNTHQKPDKIRWPPWKYSLWSFKKMLLKLQPHQPQNPQIEFPNRIQVSARYATNPVVSHTSAVAMQEIPQSLCPRPSNQKDFWVTEICQKKLDRSFSYLKSRWKQETIC